MSKWHLYLPILLLLPLHLPLACGTLINPPPTFFASLTPPDADHSSVEIEFPTWCTVTTTDPEKPVPCRPALFGPNVCSMKSKKVVWYHNNGCTNETDSPDYTNQIVLISRGKCVFVQKVYQAQSNNASGVIIVDHPMKAGTSTDLSKKITRRKASADSALIKMWAEIPDKWMSKKIHIPVVSIRNENSIDIQNQNMSMSWTSLNRAHLAYVSGKDLLKRFPDHWNETDAQRTMSQGLFKTLGLSSTILGSYDEAEIFFRKAIEAFPIKSPKAVSSIHQLGIMLLNHTDNSTKWNESLSLLPGSKPYLTVMAEVLIHRFETSRVPSFTSSDTLLFQALMLLKKSYEISGTVYTPRVTLNQAKIMSILEMDPAFTREKMTECMDDAAAYGDELSSISCGAMLRDHDKKYRFETPMWLERKKVAKEWWEWLKKTVLWPIRSLWEEEQQQKTNMPAPVKPKPTGKSLEDYQGHRL